MYIESKGELQNYYRPMTQPVIGPAKMHRRGNASMWCGATTQLRWKQYQMVRHTDEIVGNRCTGVHACDLDLVK